MSLIHLEADLKVSSETHQITVLSNNDEIGIAVQGEGIPDLGISSFKALKLLRNLPEIELAQRIRVVLNQKEIFRSDASLLGQPGKFTLIQLFFRNLFN
ncbi:hypothetical protein [Algoriphagus sediminis]|uniref:Uncharacterized protein n=1 Tax=Algoriphagus sediminis TaxID=3057113 RepID=A0ABT7YG45_9BACT|nr:hypothetical protein [Algoriphagus sediminis]MDN3205489.1 hypothetical protein [Algoriphagus sediminis]